MAQVKLLKIASDGVPVEFATTDEITLTSYTVQGTAIKLDAAAGLNMDTHPVLGVTNLSFVSPSTNVINFTAANGIIDDIMLKERNNLMTATSAVIFGVATDTAGQVDAFKVPHTAAVPTAAPAYSADNGYLISSVGKLFHWTGTVWDDLTSSTFIGNTLLASMAITDRDCLYLDVAGKVTPAKADVALTSQAIGFARNAAALLNDPVETVSSGLLDGFTGLTIGSRYYLSGATAGAITAVAPVASGHTIVQVGYAQAATALMIQFQSLGRRA